MEVSNRKWWIRFGDKEEGPLSEEEFQSKLRLGKFPLKAVIKSDSMEDFEPLLEVVADDETFRRPSKMPPPLAPGDSD